MFESASVGSDTSHKTTSTNHSPLGRKLMNEFDEALRMKDALATSSFLSVLAQLGQLAAGWMDGVWAVEDWGSEEGSRVTFLPLGLRVCQPGHSQFSPRKTGGKNFFYVPHAGWMELQPHGGCALWVCLCARCFKPSNQFHASCTHFNMIFFHCCILDLERFRRLYFSVVVVAHITFQRPRGLRAQGDWPFLRGTESSSPF